MGDLNKQKRHLLRFFQSLKKGDIIFWHWQLLKSLSWPLVRIRRYSVGTTFMPLECQQLHLCACLNFVDKIGEKKTKRTCNWRVTSILNVVSVFSHQLVYAESTLSQQMFTPLFQVINLVLYIKLPLGVTWMKCYIHVYFVYGPMNLLCNKC